MIITYIRSLLLDKYIRIEKDINDYSVSLAIASRANFPMASIEIIQLKINGFKKEKELISSCLRWLEMLPNE